MNISLIGMPASGKTTVSKELKNILINYSLIDTDEEIIKKEKMQIKEIFSLKGENYFRQVENKILSDILKNDNQIISTGGGIVKLETNIYDLKKNSIVIYLKTDINILLDRANNNDERPLLNNCDIKEKMVNLLSEREKKYELAHYIILTSKKTPEMIAKEILEKINENDRC